MRERPITAAELAAIKERAEACPAPPMWAPADAPPSLAEWIGQAWASAKDVRPLMDEIERLRALLREVAEYEDDQSTGPWPRVWAELEDPESEQQR